MVGITQKRLRRIASEWHGGQHSMLYALASTGNITPTGLHPRSDLLLFLLGEIDRNMCRGVPTKRDMKDLEDLHNWASSEFDKEQTM